MARNFDAGAEVAVAGSDFKNPEVGAHEAVLSGIIHCGSYRDLFGNELKPEVNFALAEFTLMGDDDLQDDGSRMKTYKAFPLKSGDKAFMTNLLDAVDPKEATTGFDDCISLACTVKMVGGKDKNEDGTPKYVNFGGVSGCADKLARLVYAQVEEEKLEHTGHVKYEELTEEVLKAIPPFLVRQYIINEGRGKNMSYPGSHVESLVQAIRSKDKDWAKKNEDDKSKPAQNEASSGKSNVPDAIPNAPAPAGMDEGEEY